MAEKIELPAVAKNILMDCKKCGAERFFKVLAHVTPLSAKCECEVCHSKKTFKLEDKKKKAVTAARAKAKKAASKSKDPESSWAELNEKIGANGASKYNFKSKFVVKTAISHATFGIGFVLQAFENKIDVVFEEGVKSLVHNRP